MLVASGLAIWKPVQLYWLASLMGDYEGARLLHFFAMAAVVLIVLVHVVMVIARAAHVADHVYRPGQEGLKKCA